MNPNVGYHIHAATDCLLDTGQASEHSTKVGIALDGYDIFSRFNTDGLEADDLDQCRGHTTPEQGYHYHANSAGSNAILTCHTGETGCSLESPDGVCDASVTERRGPPGGGPPGGGPPGGGPPGAGPPPDGAGPPPED